MIDEHEAERIRKQKTSSNDSSSSYIESPNGTLSDEEVTDDTSEDIVKAIESISQSGEENVSLCVNCEILFIDPYY